jgi:hypothetical protein
MIIMMKAALGRGQVVIGCAVLAVTLSVAAVLGRVRRQDRRVAGSHHRDLPGRHRRHVPMQCLPRPGRPALQVVELHNVLGSTAPDHRRGNLAELVGLLRQLIDLHLAVRRQPMVLRPRPQEPTGRPPHRRSVHHVDVRPRLTPIRLVETG